MMKKVFLAAAVFALTSMAAFAQYTPDAPPAAASGPSGPSLENCFPKEAGGTGINYKTTVHPDGRIYTWHCPLANGVFAGVWTAAPMEATPTTPKKAAELKTELTRLSSLQGHSRDGRIGYEMRAQAQLKTSTPTK